VYERAVDQGMCSLGDIFKHLEAKYRGRPCVVVFCPIRRKFFIGQEIDAAAAVGPFGIMWDGLHLIPDVQTSLGDGRSP